MVRFFLKVLVKIFRARSCKLPGSLFARTLKCTVTHVRRWKRWQEASASASS